MEYYFGGVVRRCDRLGGGKESRERTGKKGESRSGIETIEQTNDPEKKTKIVE